MRPRSLLRCVVAVGFLFALDASAARAQAVSWARLVAESDSVGPEAPRIRPGPWEACGPGVQVTDSVRVAAGSEPYLLARASLRTRGVVTYADPPLHGEGRFALHRVLCDPQGGRPRAFVVERDHRWLYLTFHLRDAPSYDALRFFSGSARPRPFHWDPARATFQP